MNTEEYEKGIVMVYAYKGKQWAEVCVGQLHIHKNQRMIELDVRECEEGKLPNFLKELCEESAGRCQIGFQRISDLDSYDEDQRIIHLRIGTNPLSLSFLDCRDSAYVREAFNCYKEKKLLQQKLNTFLEVTDDHNDRLAWVIQFLNFIWLSPQNKVQSCTLEHEGNKMVICFEILKKFIITCKNHQQIELFISDKYFQSVLNCLKVNPFNDKNFNYYQQYQRLIKINNVLKIEDFILFQSYRDNTKIKFLKDCVACMFLEVETDRTFQNFIGLNNATILEKFSTSKLALQSLVGLKDENPVMYLNIFSELWDIFRATPNDIQFMVIKENFKNKFVEMDLHTLSLAAMKTVLKENIQVNPRFHEKWTQTLGQLFNEEGKMIQSWILEQSLNFCFGSILLQMVKIPDASLKLSVLDLVNELLQPSQYKQLPSSRFVQYLYRTFVNKSYWEFNKSISSLQKYLKFLMKLYKFEPIRTRRVLIENNIILQAKEKLKNKCILISLIKMLKIFTQAGQPDIVPYLEHHHCFQGLREEFLRNKNCYNITNSCFLNLLKTVHQCENTELRKYVLKLFFPEWNF